mmetsp:Transcript_97375/g.275917  ORF Transcript_97375/g.275917 Transcript_97375/m.275917 type:complete len:209 (-) Transcript_97375:1070-1696(-)
MAAPCILTLSSRTRSPDFLAASKEKVTPLTCAKRPSRRGYCETEFSRASMSWLPDSCRRQSSSSIGKIPTRSLILRRPLSMIVSARSVPLLMKPMSAFSPLRITSATKFPMLVSLVRIEEKRQSRSTAQLPMTWSIASPTFASHSPTKTFTLGSSAIEETISTCLASTTRNGFAVASSVNSSCRTVMSRKSVPLFSTYVPCGPTGFTS